MKTGTNFKPKAHRSKAYSNGGLWICAPLWRTSELTDTEKCLVALIDGLTNLKHPCEVTDKASPPSPFQAKNTNCRRILSLRQYVENSIGSADEWLLDQAHTGVVKHPKTIKFIRGDREKRILNGRSRRIASSRLTRLPSG